MGSRALPMPRGARIALSLLAVTLLTTANSTRVKSCRALHHCTRLCSAKPFVACVNLICWCKHGMLYILTPWCHNARLAQLQMSTCIGCICYGLWIIMVFFSLGFELFAI